MHSKLIPIAINFIFKIIGILFGAELVLTYYVI